MATLQIRNMPDHVHRTLKSRAAASGMSLSEFALAELQRAADRPTRDEILERIAGRTPPRRKVSAASAVRAERERR
jgi:plasmid stability protein